jgi:hypothetical protein
LSAFPPYREESGTYRALLKSGLEDALSPAVDDDRGHSALFALCDAMACVPADQSPDSSRLVHLLVEQAARLSQSLSGMLRGVWEIDETVSHSCLSGAKTLLMQYHSKGREPERDNILSNNNNSNNRDSLLMMNRNNAAITRNGGNNRLSSSYDWESSTDLQQQQQQQQPPNGISRVPSTIIVTNNNNHNFNNNSNHGSGKHNQSNPGGPSRATTFRTRSLESGGGGNVNNAPFVRPAARRSDYFDDIDDDEDDGAGVRESGGVGERLGQKETSSGKGGSNSSVPIYSPIAMMRRK